MLSRVWPSAVDCSSERVIWPGTDGQFWAWRLRKRARRPRGSPPGRAATSQASIFHGALNAGDGAGLLCYGQAQHTPNLPFLAIDSGAVGPGRAVDGDFPTAVGLAPQHVGGAAGEGDGAAVKPDGREAPGKKGSPYRGRRSSCRRRCWNSPSRARKPARASAIAARPCNLSRAGAGARRRLRRGKGVLHVAGGEIVAEEAMDIGGGRGRWVCGMVGSGGRLGEGRGRAGGC